MTKQIDMNEQDLDDLFAEARAQVQLDSGPLLARVFADAAAHVPTPSALPQRQSMQRRPGFWATVAGALGGKGVLAGLGTAAMTGVVLGFVQPTSLAVLTDTIFAQAPLDAVELLPGIDAILSEG